MTTNHLTKEEDSTRYEARDTNAVPYGWIVFDTLHGKQVGGVLPSMESAVYCATYLNGYPGWLATACRGGIF